MSDCACIAHQATQRIGAHPLNYPLSRRTSPVEGVCIDL
jgi:hypothetical protein